jgi:Ca2+:H+ antiporter
MVGMTPLEDFDRPTVHFESSIDSHSFSRSPPSSPPTTRQALSHADSDLTTMSSFYSSVKRVQQIQRRDMLRKVRSENASDRWAKIRDTVGERTPLVIDVLSSVTEQGEAPHGGQNGSHDTDKPTEWEVIRRFILGKGIISLLLLAAPFAILSAVRQWSPIYVFVANFLVMIPLAAILGDFTEEAALHTNETIGGLINASFGNAVEVIVAIQALLANEIRVVQASMLGSIFSNLLLVLGCCCFFGGLKYKEQKFNSTAATASMGLLALSSIALILPTPFAKYYVVDDAHVLTISRIAAVFLLFMYFQMLVFQLKTHVHIFDNDEDDDEEAEDEQPVIRFSTTIIGLSTTTLLVTIFSDFLVSSIDGFVESSGISRTFVGMILLPIVGNAVEHIAAVTIAMKDKMDLAMGVAVGSCTQISLFVVPLTVLVGWAMGRNMTLNFPHFEICLYVMSVLTVSIVLGNPSTNWLNGSLLITTYMLIAVGFWFEQVDDSKGKH